MNLTELKKTLSPEDYQAFLAQAAAELPTEVLESRLAELGRGKTMDRAAYKELVAEALPVQMAALIALSAQLSEIKQQVFSTFGTIVETKKDVFGCKGDKALKTHTFSDSNYRLTIGFREVDGWDDTVSEGIEKITNVIDAMGVDKNSKGLAKAVLNLLRKDGKGNLRASSVLALEKLQSTFDNPEFTDGVKIISDAYRPQRSCWFIECYQRNSVEEWVGVPLSMAAVDFPVGYEFGGF